MNKIVPYIILLSFIGCNQNESHKSQKATELEQSLFEYIVDPWYPHCLDTIYGGYTADFEYDWTLSKGSQEKALVLMSRHIWTLAFLYEHYPERQEFLDYADHGFQFLKKNFWDEEFGGFYYSTTNEGVPHPSTIETKRIYGQAFAINGLAQYYKVSGDKEVLNLAKKTFQWMEEKVHDPIHGAYLECLNRDGSPEEGGIDPLIGLKEFNSSLHILEAFTELYKVWPDELLKKRLEEMYILFRDTIIHPDGYLKLYFYPDWTLVPEDIMRERNGENGHWYTQHVTFGHDVETAFLMLEALDVLGLEEDHITQILTKQLVDHSMEYGWDEENGGLLYAGHKENGVTTIIDDSKAFWVESEGLNALMLMETLYPDDPNDYYYSFLQMWNYIDTYLVDKDHGGWYNFGLDTNPGNRTDRKSHNWKGTYHDIRGMVRSIEMLREK